MCLTIQLHDGIIIKVITWLRLLRLVIGLKDSRQFFNQWEAKPKPIAPCTRHISRALSELQEIARNCDWFIAPFVPVVIGRSNCFGFGFSTVIWKPLYDNLTLKEFSQDTTIKLFPCLPYHEEFLLCCICHSWLDKLDIPFLGVPIKRYSSRKSLKQ